MIRSLLTQLPFFVCLFWGIFFFVKKDKQKSEHFLGLCMFIGVALHLSLIVYFNQNHLLYLYFDWLFLLSSLSIVPSYFLYIQSIAKRKVRAKDLLHFAPAVIFITVYFSLFLTTTSEEKLNYLNNFLLLREKHLVNLSNPSGKLAFLFIINRIIFLSQIITYNFVSLNIFRKFKKRLQYYYSETKGRDLTWIATLTISLTIISVASTIFNVIGRSLFQDSNIILSIPSIVFSSFFFILGLTCNRKYFTIDNLNEEERKTSKIGKKAISESPSKIKQKLELLMDEKHIYLTKDLRLSSVCKELNTNRTYLSQVLNDELNENFNSYVNKYRVNHAILLLRDKEWKNYSLDKFAELSGFGSTISMIRAFKQTTGKTPSEFRD